MFSMYELIEKKKHNQILSREEIDYIINGYANSDIPDYQMAAFLMAIWFNKLTDKEVYALTNAMASSGDILDLNLIQGIKADKHSTGGVGDKISLILLPIMASLGIKIAKMSGRGLGHTGGTIDKLESIKGFRTQIDNKTFLQNLDKVGMVIASQSLNLAPADKKIYALRDVTATVDDIPLIASSIMSKKIASGADIIVLDVKCGNGGFMHDYNSAMKLAQLMVNIGNNANKKTAVVITDMNVPLGKTIGNSLEIMEVITCLKGNMPDDIKQVVFAVGAQMLILANIASDEAVAFEMMNKEIKTNRAYDKFLNFIQSQGGDTKQIENITLLPKSNIIKNVYAQNDGYISSYDCTLVGKASLKAGAGRQRKEDIIDYGAGIYLKKIYGEYVKKNDIIAQVYSSDLYKAEEAVLVMQNAIFITDQRPSERNMVKGIIN
jgi:pyrimidine-nucleoside phosphorylase